MLVSWAAWVRSALLFRAVPSHPKWTLSRPPRSVIQSLLAPPPRLRQLRLDHARTKVKVRWSVFQLPWIPFPFRRSVRKRLRWPISSPLAPRPTSLVSAKLLLDPFPACIIRIISSDGYAFGSTGCVSSSCRQRLPSFTHSCSSCRLVPHRRRWASTSRHSPLDQNFHSFHVPWTGTPFSSISFALVSRCRHGHVSTPWFSFLSDNDGVCRLPRVPTSVSLPFSFRHVSFVPSCFFPRTCFGSCACEMAVLRSASIACCASDLFVFDTQMSCGGAPFRIGFERETPFQSGPKRSGGIPQEKGNRPEGEEAIRSTQDEGRPLVEMGRRSEDGEKGSPDRVGTDLSLIHI